mmetsp:Transcript_7044/g.15015  ORF Transcript_7044/g.15015 Transcript_7044/m.15015 type:complete len:322 (-) Transcript_7044:167-1132(-)
MNSDMSARACVAPGSACFVTGSHCCARVGQFSAVTNFRPDGRFARKRIAARVAHSSIHSRVVMGAGSDLDAMERMQLDDDALTEYRRDAPLEDEEVDKLFSRLSHVAKSQRQRAGLLLAANLRPDIIPRLVKMLVLTDTVPRRQAVQTLGVIGIPAIEPVCEELTTTEDVTVRASCIKTLAAIVLNYPELRADFPAVAMETLASVIESSDQVTKLSTVMCLGALGSRDTTRDIGGNPEAVSLLLSTLEKTEDVGLASSVVMSLGNVGTCGDAEMVLDGIQRAIEAKKGMEGGDYIVQLAEAQIERLTSKSSTAGLSGLADK